MMQDNNLQVDLIDLNDISEINFESRLIQQSFDKIEEENTVIIESSKVDQESLSLRFQV